MKLFSFADESAFKQIIAFLIIIVFSSLIFSGFAVISAFLIWGGKTVEDIAAMNTPEAVAAARYVQGWIHAGMFLVPALVFAALSGRRRGSFLNVGKFPALRYLIFAIAFYIVASPLIGVLIEWNAGLSLPSWLSGVEQWMRNSEENAKIMTEALLNTSSPGAFAANLLVMALLPALGEEFVFRGVLMRWFSGFIRNIHLNIFIVAVLFSALHMQFFGFFPRLALGIMFGYFFYWSGSLWLPVIIHFINNGAMVLFYFLYQNGIITRNPEEIGNTDSLTILFVNAILLILSVIWFSRTSKTRGDNLSFS